MTPDEVQGWLKIAVLAGGIFGVGGPFAIWALMQKRLADLEAWKEKQEIAAKEARQEAERQQKAWWDEVDALKQRHADLDKTCSNATTETRALLTALKERVDLHSTTTVTSLAGVVKNYNDMLIESVEALRQIKGKA